MYNTNNNNQYPSHMNQGYTNTLQEDALIDAFDINQFNINEKFSFFSKEELKYFSKNFKNIILFKSDSKTPYINYNVAKRVFENVVGSNYDLEIISFEFIEEFETFLVHLRIRLTRGDKVIFKDVIGSEKCARSKVDNNIINFKDIQKSAVKNGFKKFLSDYIGIGANQYAKAKENFYLENKQTAYSKKNNNHIPDNKYTCTKCGATIDYNTYMYSTTRHFTKKALCRNCQVK